MRVIMKDSNGYLTVIEADSIVATTDATTEDPTAQKDLGLGGSDELVEGLHIIPSGDEWEELFVPCEDSSSKVQSAFATGMLDLLEYDLTYDADIWDIYM